VNEMKDSAHSLRIKPSSTHCATMWQQCPKRNAHDQDPNDRRKKTAFAGRFFCKPQLAAETWCISRTTLAWGHHI
jgi:hypothetical protein